MKIDRDVIRRHFVLGAVAIVVAVVSAITPYFWTTANLVNVVDQAAIPAVLALGMCFVIGSGQIDLSIGSTTALCAIAFGYAANASGNLTVAFLASALLGCACGLVNGVFSMWVPSFIVTLGTMASFRGAALAVSGENAVSLAVAPPDLGWRGIPWLAVVAGGIALAITLIFRVTRFGLFVLATGSNERAASNAGLPIHAIRVAVLMLSGAGAGLAGALLTLRLGGARPSAGAGYELDAIAAVILGGASLTGGRISVPGVVAATILFSLIRNGLTLLSVAAAYQQVFIGAILILVVLTRNAGFRTLSA